MSTLTEFLLARIEEDRVSAPFRHANGKLHVQVAGCVGILTMPSEVWSVDLGVSVPAGREVRMDPCPHCKADLAPHCPTSACDWLICLTSEAGCGALVDIDRHRMLDRDRLPVEWT